MSPFRQPNAMATPPAGTSQEADTLVEAYAEDLMDEIFKDVDRILSGEDTAIYTDPSTQVQEQSSRFSSDAATVPAMIVPVFTQQPVDAGPEAPLTATQLGDAQAGESKPSSDGKSGPKQRRSKLILGVMGVSAIAAVGIWWLRQQPKFQLFTSPESVPTVPSTSSALSEDAAFGEYLKRSLRVISGERRVQVETQTPGVVGAVPNQSASNQSSGRQSSNVIERVFVPLLQPGSGASQPSSGANQARPNVVTTPPSLPAPSTATAPSSPTTTNEPVPNIAANNAYELVGVLELGDRSAALFDINGSSHRVYIGEAIGGSGWSIVSINNEEVVVRRNGEVRSIYIGQQF